MGNGGIGPKCPFCEGDGIHQWPSDRVPILDSAIKPALAAAQEYLAAVQWEEKRIRDLVIRLKAAEPKVYERCQACLGTGHNTCQQCGGTGKWLVPS